MSRKESLQEAYWYKGLWHHSHTHTHTHSLSLSLSFSLPLSLKPTTRLNQPLNFRQALGLCGSFNMLVVGFWTDYGNALRTLLGGIGCLGEVFKRFWRSRTRDWRPQEAHAQTFVLVNLFSFTFIPFHQGKNTTWSRSSHFPKPTSTCNASSRPWFDDPNTFNDLFTSISTSVYQQNLNQLIKQRQAESDDLRGSSLWGLVRMFEKELYWNHTCPTSFESWTTYTPSPGNKKSLW